MAKKLEMGDTIVCPYCQRRGRLVRIYKCEPPSYDVVHKTVWTDLPGQMGGLIHCEVVVDACYKGVKVSEPEPVESDHQAEEEFQL